MVRVLVAITNALQRAALAALLRQEHDLAVVGELASLDGVTGHPVWRDPPQVVVCRLEPTPVVGPLCRDGARLLMLAEAHQHRLVAELARTQPARVGFLTPAATGAQLVSAVRAVAAGQPVVHPDLVVAALTTPDDPFTAREHTVLELAAEGLPTGEIAERLGLSVGTVRNHLTRIKAKTGARTRIGAIRVARSAGWL
jgi:two-component system response regulator DesR